MAQIKQIKQSTIKRALRLHKQWLDTKHTDTPKGKRLKVNTKMINMIDFSSADFSSADFSSADFSSADFRWANFRWADFRWADWNNVRLNYINSICTNGLTVISCQLNTSDQNRSIQYWKGLGVVTAGCFSGTLDELKRRVETVHKENKVVYDKYQAVFKYIDTVLELEKSDGPKKP